MPRSRKNIAENPYKLKQTPRKFLNTHSFYTLEEFYST